MNDIASTKKVPSTVENILTGAGRRYPVLGPILPDMRRAYEIIAASFREGGQLLLCGNGGSASDSEHIAGELLKGFLLRRPIPDPERRDIAGRLASCATQDDIQDLLDRLQLGLPAIPLVSQAAIGSAVANDLGADLVYAQQVLALGRPGDVLLGISTSGNARNVLQAIKLARGLDMHTIALTGSGGGLIAEVAGLCIKVPATSTPDVQELHLPVYHTLCAMLEQEFFG
ncbi:MAG: SIS domain-containing protein [Clostridiaceae bacterium]|nr:SIS domain-containing protein [Clostridiaceae bacterium]